MQLLLISIEPENVELNLSLNSNLQRILNNQRKRCFLHTKSLAGPESLINSKTLEKEM